MSANNQWVTDDSGVDEHEVTARFQRVKQQLGRDISAVIQLWGLRVMIDLRGWKELTREEFTDENIPACVLDEDYDIVLNLEQSGVDPLPRIRSYVQEQGRSRLPEQLWEIDAMQRALVVREKQVLGALERDRWAGLPPAFARNMELLCSRIALNQVEQDLLLFACLVWHSDIFYEFTMLASKLRPTSASRIEALAIILGHDPAAVNAALAPDGKLVRVGLIETRVDGDNIIDFVRILSGLTEAMMLDYKDLFSLLGKYFSPAPESRLDLDDFHERKEDILSISRYLKISSQERRKGVNILIYGPPGTGKTELSRLLGKLAGCKSYAVTISGSDESRLNACRFAQGMLSGDSTALILFDEADEELNELGTRDIMSGKRYYGHNNKSYMTSFLEENPVPTIWICNNLDWIDPAYLRRFDMIVEIPVPEENIRRRIIDRVLGDSDTSEQFRNCMAELDWLSPATIERAKRFALCGNEGSPKRVEVDMTRHINGVAGALEKPRMNMNSPLSPLPHDPSLLNTDPPFHVVLDSLENGVQARMCFHGVPGSGKSEMARQIAKRLGRPLMVYRASDLLDPYIGVTEKKIARMFNAAGDRDAVLLVDEVESFLGHRTLARYSWEISQVNEMLAQMERYQGVCIFTTNYLEHLDRATIRRFDLKIHFRPLDDGQRWRLFSEVLERHGLEPDESLWPQLAMLEGLVPGDFVSVLRGFRLMPRFLSAQSLLDALRNELELRTAEYQVPHTRVA